MMRIAILLTVFIVLCSCKNDLNEVQEVFTENLRPGLERTEDLVIVYSDSAVAKLRIIAPTHLRYKKDRKFIDEFPDGIHVDFLEGKDNVVAWLEADRARRMEASKKTYLHDNVILVNRKGHKLITSEMIWDERKDLIYGERIARVLADGQILQGYGFKTDPDFETFELFSTKGELTIED